ncbi:TIR domain-containing protein [Ornithinicoccus halotolerans]|uniref:TIR domain-containing protein n=1 Tax=Ornithinicoccus halotolerans TaxID=1748220 RepID=UPI001294E3BF|nr:TIR domain-containing protein [Ornithinicoccus halotolerans]
MRYELGEVFNEAGLPEVTYVAPSIGQQLKGSLATKGKHVTLVGPSGSGKSTVATRTLASLGFADDDILRLNGRNYAQASTITEIFGQIFGVAPTMEEIEPWLKVYKIIFVDDVHHLSTNARNELASRLKIWHEMGIRFFLVGIAKTSEAILGQDPELAIRNDAWHLDRQTNEFMFELLAKGEEALNIEFSDDARKTATAAAQGSPSIFQAICRIACVEADVFATVPEKVSIDVDLPLIRSSVVRQYDGRYLTKIVSLARGRRQARSVHDTYYSIVEQIARSGKQQISQDELYHKIVGSADARNKGRARNSFYRAVKALPVVIDENNLSDVLIFENGTLSIDDPVFRFYLDHLDFSRVRSQVNVRRLGYEYDVAVSFAGTDRAVVSQLVEKLLERGLEVFYDFDEQAMLWGKDLRKELARVYGQDAQYMVVCLSEAYPEKDWPSFEFEIGKNAGQKRTEDYLLPLVVGDERPAIIGLPASVGHISLSDHSLDDVAELIQEKLSSLPPIRPEVETDQAEAGVTVTPDGVEILELDPGAEETDK